MSSVTVGGVRTCVSHKIIAGWVPCCWSGFRVPLRRQKMFMSDSLFYLESEISGNAGSSGTSLHDSVRGLIREPSCCWLSSDTWTHNFLCVLPNWSHHLAAVFFKTPFSLYLSCHCGFPSPPSLPWLISLLIFSASAKSSAATRVWTRRGDFSFWGSGPMLFDYKITP